MHVGLARAVLGAVLWGSGAVAAPEPAASAAPPAAADPAASGVVELRVVGDAIPDALTDEPGDPARGRRIVADRHVGLCLLCHTGPFPEERSQGNLAPDLAGAGARWSAGQLRLRIADARRIDPRSFMPSYHRTAGLAQVGSAWRDKPVLSAQQIEDVVAFLKTLRE